MEHLDDEELSVVLFDAIAEVLKKNEIPESAIVKAWSDEAILNSINSALNKLKVVVLVSLPEAEAIENVPYSSYSLTWEIMVEQNAITKGKTTKASKLALAIFAALDGLIIPNSRPQIKFRSSSLKYFRTDDSFNHQHVMKIRTEYPLIN